MNNLLIETSYFGIVLSLLTYWLAVQIRKRWSYSLLNPLLISAFLTIFVLYVLDIDFQIYNQGAQMITYLLTPSTVCLAIPLYKQTQVLVKHFGAIIVSLLCGCLSGLMSVMVLCILLKTSETVLYSLMPKSITTAIAIGVSELLGGHSTMTVGVVILTGIFGSMIAKTIFKVFHINHPVARGLALGNSAHAIGTAKAIEWGEIEAAMSSLSIVISGIFTVFLAPIMIRLWI
ncbi:LrgB family protein [Massilimicrobiota sp. An134]|uniref:LrgB family protein n=1 Tax=Massilimicrobiota sp. An134 TaxID=1965557 RepID=UPI000B38D3D8|nr:LrgB family protein [Massilimicrobiota sp. An134]OUQ30028.1 hypothetical protein B5E79_04495 [Massilimicrobiota sp. An134]